MVENEGEKRIDIVTVEVESSNEFSDRIKMNKTKFLVIFRKVLIGLKTETEETKQATKIAYKYVSKGKITKEEEHELRQQVYDILKALGIGVPFALIPGASVLIPFLVKIAQKKGINLLPSAFDDKPKLK